MPHDSPKVTAKDVPSVRKLMPCRVFDARDPGRSRSGRSLRRGCFRAADRIGVHGGSRRTDYTKRDPKGFRRPWRHACRYASGAVELRMMTRQGSASTPDLGEPSSASNSAWAATRPSSFRFMSMLVSGGRALVLRTSQLSKPITAMSPGMSRPQSRSVSMTPRATSRCRRRPHRSLDAVREASRRPPAPSPPTTRRRTPHR